MCCVNITQNSGLISRTLIFIYGCYSLWCLNFFSFFFFFRIMSVVICEGFFFRTIKEKIFKSGYFHHKLLVFIDTCAIVLLCFFFLPISKLWCSFTLISLGSCALLYISAYEPLFLSDFNLEFFFLFFVSVHSTLSLSPRLAHLLSMEHTFLLFSLIANCDLFANNVHILSS